MQPLSVAEGEVLTDAQAVVALIGKLGGKRTLQPLRRRPVADVEPKQWDEPVGEAEDSVVELPHPREPDAKLGKQKALEGVE